MSDPRVCLICCYMGPLPRYFPLWLYTCRYNPEVKFLLFGSHLPEESPVENVDFIPLTLNEFRRRASETVGFDVSLTHPRKICDFKPAYGDIFEEYVSGYDFWGHCDIDIIWGNMSFITEESILEENDVVSARGDRFVSGACTLFKNNDEVRRLYKKSPSWRKVYSEPEMLSFSEACRRPNFKKSLGNIKELVKKERLVSMTDVVFNEVKNGSLSFYTPSLPNTIKELKTNTNYHFSMKWKGGKIKNEEEKEIMAFHLLFAKKDPFFRIPYLDKPLGGLKINKKGIIPKNEKEIKFDLVRISRGFIRWSKKYVNRKAKNAYSKFVNSTIKG